MLSDVIFIVIQEMGKIKKSLCGEKRLKNVDVFVSLSDLDNVSDGCFEMNT